MRMRHLWAVVVIAFGVAVGVNSAAQANHGKRPAMPPSVKHRLAKAHAAARTGCLKVAKTAKMRQLCGVKPKVAVGAKSTMSVVAGYRQYGFVCQFDEEGDTGWSAVFATSPSDFRDGTRDFLLWQQFPPGLDEVPGGPFVMRIFASVYCDVYGDVAYPLPSSTVAPPIQPDVPVMNDACEAANDTYRLPDAVPVPLFTLFGPDETTVNLVDPDVGVMYLVDGQMTPPGTYRAPTTGDRVVTITAVATTDRYTVRSPRSWRFDFTSEPCPRPVVPVRPTVSQVVCGANNDVIARLEEIPGLRYDYGEWSANRRTVRATARDGWAIPGDPDGVVSWTFEDNATPCPIVVRTRAPSVQEMCGAANDIITVPTIEGVRYQVSEWNSDGVLSVSASALPGYQIEEGSAIGWRVTDSGRECPVVEPPLRATKLSIRMLGNRVRRADKTVTYGLIVRNTGTTTARNVVIRDPIPNGLAVVGRPVDGRLVRGVVTWRIGDLQPGGWIYLTAKMRVTRNRTIRRCNGAISVAENANRVIATRCTRFLRVAGRSFGGVTG